MGIGHILDKEQIIYLLNMFDEVTTRLIIANDDPWNSHTYCNLQDTPRKCVPELYKKMK